MNGFCAGRHLVAAFLLDCFRLSWSLLPGVFRMIDALGLATADMLPLSPLGTSAAESSLTSCAAPWALLRPYGSTLANSPLQPWSCLRSWRALAWQSMRAPLDPPCVVARTGEGLGKAEFCILLHANKSEAAGGAGMSPAAGIPVSECCGLLLMQLLSSPRTAAAAAEVLIAKSDVILRRDMGFLT